MAIIQDKYIYAADMSDDYKVHIYDIDAKPDKKSGKLVPYCPPGKSCRKRINAIDINPGTFNFISAGVG